MSNDYFNKPADTEAQTRALHTSINTLSQAVDQGFDAIPTNLSGLKSEIEAARDGETTLLEKEQAQDTVTQAVTDEVEAARDGFNSLLAKEQAQDAKIANNTILNTTGYPDQTGNEGKVLKTDGATPYWGEAKDTWEVKTADFTAEAGGNYAVDTIEGVVNCTLPVSPNIDDKISFLDLMQNFGTNALNLLRNGELIMGNADDVSIDQNNFNFSLVYTSEGWVII